MQLSRVVIAAVFIVVGGLILFPMVIDSGSSSHAASATPSPRGSASASVSPTRSGRASPSRKPSASPSRSRTVRPSTPPPPSVTPVGPLRVVIGTVRCPGRTVLVSVTNTGRETEDYAITTDGSISVADRIPAGVTRRSTLNLREDHTTTISVTLHNVPVRTLDRHANCSRKTPDQTLPHTGPDSGLIFARIATGLAAMLTGVVIFWYGRLWPRRHDKMFDDPK
jgi:hypothetical protein